MTAASPTRASRVPVDVWVTRLERNLKTAQDNQTRCVSPRTDDLAAALALIRELRESVSQWVQRCEAAERATVEVLARLEKANAELDMRDNWINPFAWYVLAGELFWFLLSFLAGWFVHGR